MRLTFLGTGTSHGVPAIGCDCAVCQSENPRNRRTRSSLYVQSSSGHAVLVDVTPEFRLQAIASGIRRVDAVVLTHGHADHIMGMDDLRRINEIQNGPVPIHASPETLAIVRRTFAYAFEPGPPGPTCPALELHPWDHGALQVGDLRVVPLPCQHGPFSIYGFLFEERGRRAAYFPDCNGLPELTLRELHDLDVMILDGLRPQPHPTHFSLPESLTMMARIGARRSFITHICHLLEHEATQAAMPEGCYVPWDGLVLELP